MIYENYPELECVSADIGHAVDMIADSYKNGGKLMTAGNGGSASDSEYIGAQTRYGHAKPGDTALRISTSGNAKNLYHAADLAKCIGVKTIALTGKTGGKLAEICDHAIKVPSTETYRVQEYHLPVYHEICARIEDIFFDN